MNPICAHPIPDRRGVNLFTKDPTPCDLLPMHLPAERVEHLLPHLERCVLSLRVLPRARALADGEAECIDQDDTFFCVPVGRLKLREFADGSAELIHYHRPDVPGARASDYVRVPVADAAALREALARGCGVLGRVRKRRLMLRVGATRVHLDRVEGLGDFIEIEVVLHEAQPDDEGRAIAEQLLQRLGLGAAPQLAGAYLDLATPGVDVEARRGAD